MQRDASHFLDIIHAAKLIMEYTAGLDRTEFLQSTQIQDSVIRRFEVMGEAARRVSQEAREALPEVPWAQMVSMRNFLIHDYGDVDLDTVWDTAQRDIPRLLEVLREATPPETD